MRLSASKRESIVESESRKRFHEKILELENNIRKEVEELVKKNIPDYITDKLIEDKWIKVSSVVRIVDNNGYKVKFPGLNYQPFNTYPLNMNEYAHEIKLTKKIESKIKIWEKESDNRREFKRKLLSTLNGFSTAKRLIDAIPELSEYFINEGVSTALVPIEQIEETRKMLKSK